MTYFEDYIPILKRYFNHHLISIIGEYIGEKLPVPIKRSKYEGEFECCCKGCKKGYDHMHCWTWSRCSICRITIWFNSHPGYGCTLYSRSLSNGLICFYCREPYYKKGMSSGEIHRLLLN